jgi:beta-galactosidase
VSDDHYLWSPDEDAHIGLALSADLTRSVARGKPWILMEHSTSAVNWQGHNIAKRPGEMHRNAFTHLGRGADGILFFQWRASRSGAEKFHSAMLPHAGTGSRVFREVVDLGARLGRLAEVRGSRVRADVAVLYDWESLWAQDLEWRPSDELGFRERVRAYYERLWRDGVTIDFAHPEDDLSGYRLVVAPASYLLTEAAGKNLDGYVAQGGTLLVSCFAGVVDEHDAVHEGGFGAPLRPALGLTVEEFLPVRPQHDVSVDLDGTSVPTAAWSEHLVLDGAEVRGTYRGGPADGLPAITRHAHGEGTGWYVSTRLGVEALAPVLAAVYADAGIEPSGLPEGVEVVLRHGDAHDYLVAVNHRDEPVTLAVPGTELLHGTQAAEQHEIGAGAVAVLRTSARSQGGGR